MNGGFIFTITFILVLALLSLPLMGCELCRYFETCPEPNIVEVAVKEFATTTVYKVATTTEIVKEYLYENCSACFCENYDDTINSLTARVIEQEEIIKELKSINYNQICQ